MSDAQRDVVDDVGRVLHHLETRPPLLERLGDLHPVGAVDGAGKLPAEVVLAGEEGGGARGVVLVHHELDAVDVGQPGHEVLRVAHEREPDIGPVAVEHPGPRADHGLGFLQVAEFLHALARDDGAGHGAGDHVEEPGEGLFQREPYRVAVRRLDFRDGAEHRHVAALVGQDVLERVAHVLRRQLAPVDGGLAVEADAAAELELVGRVVDLPPRLGEVALDGEGAGADARPRPVLEEAAMREAHDHVRAVGVRQDVIEVGRVPRAEIQRAAALRGLSRGGLGRSARRQRGGDEAGGAGGKQGAARDRGRDGVVQASTSGAAAGREQGGQTVARGAGSRQGALIAMAA